MRIVEANPARPIRIVNIAGGIWVLLTILASLIDPMTSSVAVALYFPLTLVLIVLIAWYTPSESHFPWFTTNLRITVFLFSGLVLGMSFTLFVAGSNNIAYWPDFVFQGVIFSAVFYFGSLPFYFIAYKVLKRVRRFLKPFECRSCGYNLTGNISGRCPECGTECANTIQGSVDQQEDRVENR